MRRATLLHFPPDLLHSLLIHPPDPPRRSAKHILECAQSTRLPQWAKETVAEKVSCNHIKRLKQPPHPNPSQYLWRCPSLLRDFFLWLCPFHSSLETFHWSGPFHSWRLFRPEDLFVFICSPGLVFILIWSENGGDAGAAQQLEGRRPLLSMVSWEL